MASTETARVTCVALVAALGCATPDGARTAVEDAPRELTDATYARVASLVELKPGDLQFQAVDWYATAYEGLLESQRADKPLLLWLYFGGPRGAC